MPESPHRLLFKSLLFTKRRRKVLYLLQIFFVTVVMQSSGWCKKGSASRLSRGFTSVSGNIVFMSLVICISNNTNLIGGRCVCVCANYFYCLWNIFKGIIIGHKQNLNKVTPNIYGTIIIFMIILSLFHPSLHPYCDKKKGGGFFSDEKYLNSLPSL